MGIVEEYNEEAAFAALMKMVAEAEGARLLQECERLRNDPDAAVPPELDEKCLKIILGEP